MKEKGVPGFLLRFFLLNPLRDDPEGFRRRFMVLFFFSGSILYYALSLVWNFAQAPLWLSGFRMTGLLFSIVAFAFSRRGRGVASWLILAILITIAHVFLGFWNEKSFWSWFGILLLPGLVLVMTRPWMGWWTFLILVLGTLGPQGTGLSGPSLGVLEVLFRGGALEVWELPFFLAALSASITLVVWILDMGARAVSGLAREQVGFISALLETIPIPIIVVDRVTGRIQDFNDAFFVYCGLKRDQIEGSRFTDFLGGEAVGAMEGAGVGEGDMDNAQMFEFQFRHADGMEHDIVVFQKQLQASSDGTGYLVSVIVDITDRKRQLETLEELNATKDRLFSLIGHDLRSPVGKFKQLLDIYVDQPEMFDDATWKLLFLDLRQSATALYLLLENLLLWARSRRGDEVVKQTRFPLLPLVQELDGLFKASFQEKGVQMVLQVPQEVHLTTDRDMVYTIMRNLVSNALKFTPSGGAVTLRAREEGDTVFLGVQDTGQGLSPAVLARLRSRKSTLTTLGTNQEKGAGFGMTLVFDFIRILGGDLDIQSEVGQGSVFEISLPADPPGVLEEL